MDVHEGTATAVLDGEPGPPARGEQVDGLPRLTRAQAATLSGKAGQPALKVIRHYFDGEGRPLMATVGLYPGERLSHNTRLRIQPARTKGFP